MRLLKEALDAAQLHLLKRVAEEAETLALPIYMIGGSVRDLLLGSVIKDFDLTVEGDAITLARALAKKYGGKVTAHPKFGTAKWFLPPSLISSNERDTLDFVSTRSETYKHPGALPTVRLGTLEEDIRRRDFTINALALRLDGQRFGELIDLVGGQADLERKVIRVLHPKSFVDDPTRMYRAVRYEQRYAFQIAEETLALIPHARPLVAKLSAQRIRHELDLILQEDDAALMLRRLEELNLLSIIHPALSFDDVSYARLEKLHTIREVQPLLPWNVDKQGRVNKPYLGWLLWLMPFPRETIGALNERLHFTADLYDSLMGASSIHSILSSFVDLKPSQYVERLEAVPLDALEALYFAAPNERTKDIFFKYLAEWRHVKPHITGDDLKKRNLAPGPKYALILRRLRNAWLDGQVKTEEEEAKLLETLLSG